MPSDASSRMTVPPSTAAAPAPLPCHRALHHLCGSTQACPLELQALLAAAVENTDDAIIGKALDGRILSWNAGAERLYGYAAEEVLGHPISILLAPDAPDSVGEILERVRQGESIHHREAVRVRKDGQCIDVSLTVSPIRDGSGAVIGASTIARDISESKRAAQALRRVNRALHAIIAVQEALVAAADEDALLEQVCRILVEAGGYRMAWAGWAEEDAAKRIRPVAHAGLEAGYLSSLDLTWADTERGRGPSGTAIRTGRPAILRDTATDATYAPWRDEALRRGYASAAALPVSVAGSVRACLAVYASEPDAFDHDEVDLLLRLTANVGYGIETLRARGERERAAKALTKLSMAVQQAADGIVITDRDGVIEYVNPAFEQSTGYTAAEAVGQTPRLLKSGMHPPEIYGDLWATVLSGRVWRGVLANRRKDGGLQHEDKVIVPLKDAKGRVTHFVATSRDITERVRAQETQARLAAIIEAMPDLVATAGVAGHILTLNPAGRALLGIAEGASIEGLMVEDLYSEETRQLWRSEAVPTAARDGAWSGEAALRSAQGQDVPVAQVVLAHHCGDGSISFLSLIAHDLRERRRLEGELRQAQKMEAVGRLAGGVAHDFNNVLTPIVTYSDLLLMRLDAGDPLRRYAEQIAKTADRAASLPRQLLAFSRKQVLRPKVVDLNLLVRDMEKMLRRLIGEDVELTFTPQEGLGYIKADPGQIEQVLMNLVVNARDAMPQGGKVTITTAEAELDAAYARRHPGAAPGPYVVLTVTDTGCGMDPETQARIFEPFFTTKEEGKGTGLGLSTVYGIVTQSGGHIRVASELGSGTTFRIHLPRTREMPEPRGGSELLRSIPRGTETVLLVEDDEGVRVSTQEFLTMAGYSVLEASSGEAAIERLERHGAPVHLLLTDVVMPGIGGRELAERVLNRHPQMRVLYLSGYTADTLVQHGVASTEAGLLQKPFTPGALLRRVRAVLDGQDDAPPPRS